jgi:hypothetical protein
MNIPSKLVSAIAIAIHGMCKNGYIDDAAALIDAIEGCDDDAPGNEALAKAMARIEELEGRIEELEKGTVAGTAKAQKRTRVRTDEERARDRDRKRAKRTPIFTSDQRKVVGHGRTLVGIGRTNVGQNTPLKPPSDQEEKRRVSEFRVVSADLNSIEKSGSSDLSARASEIPTKQNGRTRWSDMVGQTRGGYVLKRIQEVLHVKWDIEDWKREADRIADKPDAELEKVLKTLSADPWVLQQPSRADPRHIISRWARYLSPPPRLVLQEVDPEERRRMAIANQNAEMDRRREAELRMKVVPYGR